MKRFDLESQYAAELSKSGQGKFEAVYDFEMDILVEHSMQ